MELHWVHPEVFRDQDRDVAEARIVELAQDQTDLIDVRITARPTANPAQPPIDWTKRAASSVSMLGAKTQTTLAPT